MAAMNFELCPCLDPSSQNGFQYCISKTFGFDIWVRWLLKAKPCVLNFENIGYSSQISPLLSFLHWIHISTVLRARFLRKRKDFRKIQIVCFAFVLFWLSEIIQRARKFKRTFGHGGFLHQWLPISTNTPPIFAPPCVPKSVNHTGSQNLQRFFRDFLAWWVASALCHATYQLKNSLIGRAVFGLGDFLFRCHIFLPE